MDGPCLLDHTAFPHILENIVVYAASDLPSAISLRATCRSVRDTIDAELFAHVVLIEQPHHTTQIRSVSSPTLHLPFHPPFESPTDNDTVTEEHKSRSRLLSYIKRVDYFGRPPTLLKCSPQKVECVRRAQSSQLGVRQTTQGSFVGRTTIDFANVTGGGLSKHPFVDVQGLEGTERHVLHLDYDPAHPELYQTVLRLRFAPSVSEVVYVFNIDRSSTPYAGVKEHISPHIGFLYGLLTSMMPVLGRGGRIIFVGVDEVPAIHLDLQDTMSPAERRDSIKQAVAEWISEWEDFLFDQPDQFGYGTEGISWTPDDIQRSIDSVTFITRNEWRASLPANSLDDTRMPYHVEDQWLAAAEHVVYASGDWDDEADFFDDDFDDEPYEYYEDHYNDFALDELSLADDFDFDDDDDDDDDDNDDDDDDDNDNDDEADFW